jgi:hypothetical protein
MRLSIIGNNINEEEAERKLKLTVDTAKAIWGDSIDWD